MGHGSECPQGAALLFCITIVAYLHGSFLFFCASICVGCSNPFYCYLHWALAALIHACWPVSHWWWQTAISITHKSHAMQTDHRLCQVSSIPSCLVTIRPLTCDSCFHGVLAGSSHKLCVVDLPHRSAGCVGIQVQRACLPVHEEGGPQLPGPSHGCPGAAGGAGCLCLCHPHREPHQRRQGRNLC